MLFNIPHPVSLFRWASVAGSFHTAKSGARKDQENGSSINSRSTNSCDGLVGVLFSSMRRAYSPPVSVPVSPAPENVSGVDARVGGASRGVGTLDLCLAEQCGAVLRVLYKVPLCVTCCSRFVGSRFYS